MNANRVITDAVDIIVNPTVASAGDTQAALEALYAALQSLSGINAQRSYLVSGGGVAWQSAYTFLVSAATYYINGVFYTSPQTQVSLTTADPSHDRIDVIVVNTSGAVAVVTGTAATTPAEPAINPATQLKLAIISVPAGSTQPTSITSEAIYVNNAGPSAEWTTTVSNAAWNPNATTTPRSSPKDISGTNQPANSYVQFQRGTTLALANVTNLVAYIRLPSAAPNGRALRFQWYLSGVAAGVAVNPANYGMDGTLTGSWQQVVIPIAAFQATSANQLRLLSPNGAFPVLVDDVSVQSITGGIQGPPGAAGTTIYSGGGAPASTLGVNGDYYINTANGDLYKMVLSSWGIIMNLKGPTGATGSVSAGRMLLTAGL